jgi:hypothetical protein
MALSFLVFLAAGVEDLLHRPASSDFDLTCVDMCGVFKNDTQFEPTIFLHPVGKGKSKIHRNSHFEVGNILEESF